VKVLFDEHMPVPLCKMLPGHEVVTVEYLGWKGTKNGALLRKAVEAGFEGMVSRDKSMPYQNNIPGSSLRVVLLVSPDRDDRTLIPRLKAALPEVSRVLPLMKPGQVVRIPV